MRLKVNEVDITEITRDEARQIRNELMQATGGNLELQPDKYPQLIKLFKLLSGAFESSYHGVHHISKREQS